MSTISETNLQDSFWFHRDGDEEFVGNLITKKALDPNKKDVAYTEFIATSTRLSLASFANYKPQSENLSPAKLDAAFIANEMLPNIPHALTWKEAAYKYKMVIVACVVAVFAVIFVGVFTGPVTSLNNGETTCSVVESFSFDVECENGSTGYCLEHLVSLPEGDGLFTFGILQGFELVQDLESQAELNCAVTNCVEDPTADIDINNLPDECVAELEELNITADVLNENELIRCVALSFNFACVEVRNSDSVFKSLYFDLDFEADSNTAISLPKQPSPGTVAISTISVFVLLFIIIALAVLDVRRYKHRTLDDFVIEEDETPEPNATLQNPDHQ